jgi:hypothetical protein
VLCVVCAVAIAARMVSNKTQQIGQALSVESPPLLCRRELDLLPRLKLRSTERAEQNGLIEPAHTPIRLDATDSQKQSASIFPNEEEPLPGNVRASLMSLQHVPNRLSCAMICFSLRFSTPAAVAPDRYRWSTEGGGDGCSSALAGRRSGHARR